VLTNAMRPMMRRKAALAGLNLRFGARLRLRVSLDDPRPETHDAERGAGSYAKTMEGLRWLAGEGFNVEIAGRRLAADDERALRDKFRALLAAHRLPVEADDPSALVIFPELAPDADPPEITEACWAILDKSPEDVMCATARMIVKRSGAERPAVIACTLLPYDPRFELGATLAEAARPVPLNHKYCASFCVLGAATCGAAKA
jgi:hypothetical protein